jgi:hypothetical protein|tara:strand:- start:41 stop:385 length:345 start_codon:yes stop_codon:yes gene_type:complete
MIELLNMQVHTITIDSWDLQKKIPNDILPHNIEHWINQTVVYEWYLTTDLGKHLIRLSDPKNNDIDIVKKWDSDEHHIHISTWLSQAQIDRIELAFFIKLKRKSHRSKYSFESL